jgi:hypothetical protein
MLILLGNDIPENPGPFDNEIDIPENRNFIIKGAWVFRNIISQ